VVTKCPEYEATNQRAQKSNDYVSDTANTAAAHHPPGNGAREHADRASAEAERGDREDPQHEGDEGQEGDE